MGKLFIAVGVIVSFLIITSVPSVANDVIYGCVDKNGKLRIVNDPGVCKKNETPILWNVPGPQGSSGDDGAPGPPGPPGEPGSIESIDTSVKTTNLHVHLEARQAQQIDVPAGLGVLVTGGGFEVDYLSCSDILCSTLFVAGSRPIVLDTGQLAGWQVTVMNTHADQPLAFDISVFVVYIY